MKERSERSRCPHVWRMSTTARAVARALVAAPLVFGTAGAFAQQAPADDSLQEIVVSGDRLDVIPTKPLDSVFGFGKPILETPRSVTSISSELLEKTIITGINDLVALTPGAFTESFFGVAGSLDVRGSPGENYFRGMRRISNPGNYPTAIGASDSIDIVRGPASPIFSPSQIGGYLNFVPKSAMTSSGELLTEQVGKIEATGGSWGKKVLSAEVGGPTSLFGKELGYYLYAQSENSGSYYQNTATQQSILQMSFNMKWSESLRSEFGGMYQYFKGNQVAGWNRLTQALINNGTYVTGSPPNLDTNGDGLLSQAEANAGQGLNPFYAPAFGDTPASLAAQIAGNPNLALVNPGVTHINGNQVLVAPSDDLGDNVTTLYHDLIGELPGGIKMTNKTFGELLRNKNLDAYGFSQYANTNVLEDDLIFAKTVDFTDFLKAAFQVSPSVRYSHFEQGDDFSDEYFDRRDITLPSSPIDHRTEAVLGQDAWSDHATGHYIDYGFALLSDTTLFHNLDALIGGRYDYIDMHSRELPGVIGETTPADRIDAKDSKGSFSYSASLSYTLPAGLHPYVTYAKEQTLILGQGGEIAPASVEDRNAVGGSTLKEIGIKATELDGHLYVALDWFDQQRVDFNAQATVTNNTTRAKGTEFEMRYVVNPMLTITGAYTHLKIENIGISSQGGYQFNDLGAGDLVLLGINPASAYGGSVGSLVSVNGDEHTKAGIPQNVYSLNFLGSADPWVHGLSGTIALSHVSAVPSGFTGVVTLPKYTLLNMGLRYEMGKFAINGVVKNATNERYFRSNFPDLFGSNVVLPELPRNYLLTGTYKF
jgi:iron complex outermembrane receptor protein